MTLYAATIFLSAFLLFQIQPLIAKIILPWFGGSAAVWAAALLFFQLSLLAGYAYAHALIKLTKARTQLLRNLCQSWVRVANQAELYRDIVRHESRSGSGKAA